MARSISSVGIAVRWHSADARMRACRTRPRRRSGALRRSRTNASAPMCRTRRSSTSEARMQILGYDVSRRKGAAGPGASVQPDALLDADGESRTGLGPLHAPRRRSRTPDRQSRSRGCVPESRQRKTRRPESPRSRQGVHGRAIVSDAEGRGHDPSSDVGRRGLELRLVGQAAHGSDAASRHQWRIEWPRRNRQLITCYCRFYAGKCRVDRRGKRSMIATRRFIHRSEGAMRLGILGFLLVVCPAAIWPGCIGKHEGRTRRWIRPKELKAFVLDKEPTDVG